MTMTDPIADMLTRIRNAHISKHDRVSVPASKLKMAICRILEREGYIEGFRVEEAEPSNQLDIRLRYDSQGTPAITKVYRVSKPGRRVYKGADEIEPVLNGIGTAIVSTSSGLLTDHEARTRRVGGEILCELY
jgi:small subunit ribosomal protein S8